MTTKTFQEKSTLPTPSDADVMPVPSPLAPPILALPAGPILERIVPPEFCHSCRLAVCEAKPLTIRPIPPA